MTRVRLELDTVLTILGVASELFFGPVFSAVSVSSDGDLLCNLLPVAHDGLCLDGFADATCATAA
jgi:hypothetical protein